MILNDISQNML